MDAIKSSEVSAIDFQNEKIITRTENGKLEKYVLLSDSRIAKVVKGKGKDVEKATMEAGQDRTKFLSSLMASTTTIDGKAVNMFELGEIDMDDYLQIQVAFSEINF